MSMDKGKVTALVLLDLSAAFDTIDHKLLITRLSKWYGINGRALMWFSSYLLARTQSVKVLGTLSEIKTLLHGVPQGSVLGPLLFSLYTLPLSSIIELYPLQHKLYADDTQIYISFTTGDYNSSIDSLKACLNAVNDWMFCNKLKLNPDKTEFLLIGNQIQRKKFSDKFPIEILGNKISPAKTAKNLGITFDQDFSLKQHAINLCRNCYYHIRDFKQIRKHIDISVATGIANALVSSRLDYCNSLFLCSYRGVYN